MSAAMRALLVALVLVFSGSAWAQALKTKEETFDYVSKELAEIQAMVAPVPSMQVEQMEAGHIQTVLDEALARAWQVKETLEDNPYVRLSGVTVGFPWGISLKLEFLDGSDE